MGAEIIRLWVASTDYSGDLGIDDKILARVVDAYRRIRNTLRFLLANTSDFDASKDAVLRRDAGDRPYALARAAQLQQEIRPLQGLRVPPRGRQAAAVLLGRPGRLLPGRAQGPPLHQRPQEPGTPLGPDRALPDHPGAAALDGALPVLHGRGSLEEGSESIFLEKFTELPAGDEACWPSGRACEIRNRQQGHRSGAYHRAVGSSLQAEVTLTAGPKTWPCCKASRTT
jgi:isoleucyl-tRNA synthetase